MPLCEDPLQPSCKIPLCPERCHKVTLECSLLQAEKTQLSQPVFIKLRKSFYSSQYPKPGLTCCSRNVWTTLSDTHCDSFVSPVQGEKLDSMVHVDPIQLRTFCTCLLWRLVNSEVCSVILMVLIFSREITCNQ